MNAPVAAALLVSCLCAAGGQILLKLGATGRTTLMEFVNAPVFLGLAAYAAGLALWMFALSRLPLFVVYPFTFLTVICVGIFSFVFLGERPTALAYAGWAIVAVGLSVIWTASRSS